MRRLCPLGTWYFPYLKPLLLPPLQLVLLPETSFVSVGEEGSQSVSKKVKMPPHAWESACGNRVRPCVLAQGHEAEGHFQKDCKLGKGRHRAAGM